MKFSIFKFNTVGGLLLNLALAFLIPMIFFFLYFYAYLGSVTHQGQHVSVPDLTGMSVNDLEAFLKKNQLRFDVADSSYEDRLPPNTVVYQFPKPGARVKIDRLIHITVNSEKAPTLPMPNLVDKSLTNAKVVLEGNSLKIGKISYASSPYQFLVLSMTRNGKPVKAGERLAKGSVIDLVVGDGGMQANMVVGNLVRESYERALLKLRGWNMKLGRVLVVEGQDTTGVKTFVVKQNPAAGDSARFGSPVDLWIAPQGYKIPKE